MADRLSTRVKKKTVGKGEIACHEQFLLFPQYVQTTCTADTSKSGLVLERVNPLPDLKILDWSKLKQIADDIRKCI